MLGLVGIRGCGWVGEEIPAPHGGADALQSAINLLAQGVHGVGTSGPDEAPEEIRAASIRELSGPNACSGTECIFSTPGRVRASGCIS